MARAGVAVWCSSPHLPSSLFCVYWLYSFTTLLSRRPKAHQDFFVESAPSEFVVCERDSINDDVTHTASPLTRRNLLQHSNMIGCCIGLLLINNKFVTRCLLNLTTPLSFSISPAIHPASLLQPRLVSVCFWRPLATPPPLPPVAHDDFGIPSLLFFSIYKRVVKTLEKKPRRPFGVTGRSPGDGTRTDYHGFVT